MTDLDQICADLAENHAILLWLMRRGSPWQHEETAGT